MLAHSDPKNMRPYPHPGRNPSHFTPLLAPPPVSLRRSPTFPDIVGNGYESDNSRSIDWDLVPCRDKEELVVRLALRQSLEETQAPQSESLRRESIASAQVWLGTGGSRRMTVAEPEAASIGWR